MNAEEKRFDATPARRERAKREGNAARSSEVNAMAAFGAAVPAAAAAIPFIAAGAVVALAAATSHAGSDPRGLAAPAMRVSFSALAVVALGALVPAATAAGAGTLAALAQRGGLHFSGLHLEAKRLDPFAGLKRMCGAETAVGIARAGLALVATALALLPLARDIVGAGPALGAPRAAATALSAPGAAASLVAFAALRACLAAWCVGAVFALADYVLVRRRWLRGLKMSFEELKRDAKENEGDPQARARRKSAHRTIVRGAVGRTREASFVVVNPQHVAVALRYAPPDVPVPEILVRALDEAALRVKALARECGIPLVEDVALARLLYAHGESGRAIPPDAYVAVAQIVAALAREGVLA
ncbi:MAG: EscU/YscU/HrcU family type III secretion system export apparatus switch protein [Candidatus Eremiobacteraeota bacterium]|nr:EscU/YscU/HrcU family type III secretion system export apparatus switch protein [Candidatus Eremiobacteraeota bacterium]